VIADFSSALLLLDSSAGHAYLFVVALLLGLMLLGKQLGALFFVAAFPATLLHELSHLLVGLITFGRPSGMRLWPQRSARGYVLGSVTCRNVRWYNGLLIGLAPLFLLPVAAVLLLWRVQASPRLAPEDALWMYTVASLLYAGLPSWQDLRIAAGSSWLLILLAVSAVLAVTNGWLPSAVH